eukprot:GHVL01006610.1.p1 GENE.GHVL01006610.1~~GHVL01006610.1.p1  ORF type:complete len:603 (+),score=131.33 GHVL01006610.1:54-1862(+)
MMKLDSRLSALRDIMKKNKIDCFLIPSNDAHMSEYISKHDERRQWISGFTGSAGSVVVTNDEALLWTDGRYWLQAADQLSSNWQLMKAGEKDCVKLTEWIKKIEKIGIDPNLTSVAQYEEMIKEIPKERIFNVDNFVDEIWTDQPIIPQGKIEYLDIKYSGKDLNEKIESIRELMKKKNADLLVLSGLDEIAWMLNLRGCDVDCNPVFYSYLLIPFTGSTVLFVHDKKLSSESEEYLLKNNIKILNYNNVFEFLQNFQGRVWMDKSINLKIYSAVEKDKTLLEESPVKMKKCVKNSVELKGARECHIRDGAAKSRFLCWLEEGSKNGTTEGLSETDLADKLYEFRKEVSGDMMVGPSFQTISGLGSNGAVIHHRPDSAKKLSFQNGGVMYLVDSGSQYFDGTTDVTRSVYLRGPKSELPGEHEKECYTRVLKGHLALRLLIFPVGTHGTLIDSFARSSLWKVGLDFCHSTGHGVGSYLNVHEGPIGIGPRIAASTTLASLDKDMILSNEPGYYEEGNFGVRVENLFVTVPAKTAHNFMGKQFLTFEDLTLIPHHKHLIKKDILNKEEIDYINEYHQEVLKKIGGYMKTDLEKEWLNQSCSPL